MTTIWQNMSKRNIGNENTLMDDTIVIFDSPTSLFGGSALATVWTFINKTS